ncbi:MAG: hypothetical protein J7L37_04785 [Thermococcus sp.]|nr:hypothetical protein [Thermococcus sp.]
MFGTGAGEWISSVIALALLASLFRSRSPEKCGGAYILFSAVYFGLLTLLTLLIPEEEFFTIEKGALWVGLVIVGAIGFKNPVFFSRIVPFAVFLGLRPLVVSEFGDFHSLSLHILIGEVIKFAVWCSGVYLVLNRFVGVPLEDVPLVFLPLSLSGIIVGIIEFLDWGLSAFYAPWFFGSAIIVGGWVLSFWRVASRLEASVGRRSYLLSAFLGAGLFYVLKPF